MCAGKNLYKHAMGDFLSSLLRKKVSVGLKLVSIEIAKALLGQFCVRFFFEKVQVKIMHINVALLKYINFRQRTRMPKSGS